MTEVCVIFPVHDRKSQIQLSLVETAVKSVLDQTFQNWKLIIIGDGKQNQSVEEYIAKITASESRCSYISIPKSGASAARNAGIQYAKGTSCAKIIAYLDSDNYYTNEYLETIVKAYNDDSEMKCCYCSITNIDTATEITLQLLEERNVIDINIFSHRIHILEHVGLFDERLTRLIDWDFIQRCVVHSLPKFVNVVGAVYRGGSLPECSWSTISNTNSIYYNQFLITQKQTIPKQNNNLNNRILYSVWHYNQLSETYIEWELQHFQKMNYDIRVWAVDSSAKSPAPRSVFTYENCSVKHAIDDFKPHMIHCHWLVNARTDLDAFGIPITVRLHGFEFTLDRIRDLIARNAVKRIFMPKHIVRICSQNGIDTSKLTESNVCINPKYHFPNPISIEKPTDLRIVLRVGAALRTKDLGTFLIIANRMRHKFRFIGSYINCSGHDGVVTDLQKQNESLGNPVTLLVNQEYSVIGDLMRKSSIYLHTTDPQIPFGQPISIAESMACKNVILVRETACNGSKEYVDNAGFSYKTVDEAVSILESLSRWTPDQWEEAQRNSIDRAFQNHAPNTSLTKIHQTWQEYSSSSTQIQTPTVSVIKKPPKPPIMLNRIIRNKKRT